MITILSVVFFMAYADENLSEVDAKIQECKNDKNGKSCYELGQYFLKNNEENSSNQALYYYEQGCKNNNQESCIEEVNCAIKNKSTFSKQFFQKIVLIGDLYFQKKEYKKAFNYYSQVEKYYDSETLYKQSLSSIQFDTNISNAERYYLHYIRSVIYHINFYSKDNICRQKQDAIELQFALLKDGSISELMITKPSQDDDFNKCVYASIQKLPKFHSIPFELKKEKKIIRLFLELRAN